ncbi:MAG TPA: diguanylate cyclase [Gammaproteobacteria bacterium]|nr:diguanylate cyclase [Gammaproteobacteria bacterium]
MTFLADKPGKITPEILAEQTKFSFEIFPVAVSMLITALCVMAFLVWNEIDHDRALIWFAAAVLVVALRFGVYYWYKATEKPEERAEFWRRMFLLGAYSTSLVLGAAGALFFSDLPPAAQTLFMLLLLGIVSGSLPVMALDLRSYTFYVVIALTPLVSINLAASDVQLKLLGVLVVVYIIMLMLSGYMFSRVMVDSLIYRHRSKNLAERLQVANMRLSSVNEELERISTVDELTGTFNRRYFNLRFEEVWNDHMREQTTLSALMIDVDYFKIYNDNYGHIRGDNCLQKIAHEIIHVIRRPRDFAARFGGEEFIVLLPKTDSAGAREIATRIHQQIERLAIPHKRPDKFGRVTVSIGGSSVVPSRDMTDDAFLQRVDQALQQAKAKGRNTSVLIP